MEAIHVEHLISLANFLERLPPEKFNFAHWVGGTWAGLPDLSCGTTACALGWASSMQQFRALGLRLSNAGEQDNPIHPHLADDAEGDFWRRICNATNFIFGITEEETQLLFTPTDDSDDVDNGDQASIRAIDGFKVLEPNELGLDRKLSRRASAKRVAQHIREFCEIKLQKINQWLPEG